MSFVRGAAYGSPMTIPKWAAGALIGAVALTSTGCAAGPSVEDVRACMTQDMDAAAGADITDREQVDYIIEVSAEDCGYYDLTESEQAAVIAD